MPDAFSSGIVIADATAKDLEWEQIRQAHRDDYHVFLLLKEGKASFEVDFRKLRARAFAVMYIQPYQVHKVLSVDSLAFTALLINDDNLNPDYRKALEEMAPAKPLILTEEAFSMLSETASLCLTLYNRQPGRLYYSLLKDSCNTLVGLIASQFIIQSGPAEALTRFEVVARAFKALLEKNFTSMKRPAFYADSLKISIPYLNECVKNVTGFSVSHHIQQRVVLEAKRLLYHSDRSVKEIAAELGYDDHAYFSRLFTKVEGLSAIAFRNKNRD
jgi:AraC family transcriptional activator of pobA